MFLVQLIYKPFFEYKYGATPGKMALKLKVLRKDFEQAGLKEILLRNSFDITFKIVTLVSTITVFRTVEFLSVTSNEEFEALNRSTTNSMWYLIIFSLVIITDAIFLLASKKNRALHDMMGDTVVVRL